MQNEVFFFLPYLRRVSAELELVCKSDMPALLWGETGTGKTVLARHIHERSARRAGPFQAVHVHALPEALVAAELFGYEKGAFTGAHRPHVGLLKAADGGSFFLDQLESLHPDHQACLLEAVETGSFYRLGASKRTQSNFRLLSACLENPAGLVKLGKLRMDFYQRISTLEIHLPPLRQRPEDLEFMVHRFLQRLNEALERSVRLTPDGREELLLYSWPGNIRELWNVLYRLVWSAKEGWIGGEMVRELVGKESRQEQPLREVVRQAEREHIGRVLTATGGRLRRAARILDISLNTLKRKIREYGIACPPDREGGSDRGVRNRHL